MFSTVFAISRQSKQWANTCRQLYIKVNHRTNFPPQSTSTFLNLSCLVHNFPSTSPGLYSVLFYGSDEFSLKSLKQLQSKLISPPTNTKTLDSTALKNLEVVTTSSNNPIHEFCIKKNLPCHLFDNYSVPSGQFDFGVVSSFGRLIPKQSIQACRHGILNIHGSLLPRWRGASPIQHSILADDKVTGITIMRIEPEKFDVGKIVAQQKIEVFYRITTKNLKNMLASVGAELLWKCIQNLEQSLAEAYDQPNEGVTWAPKLKPSDGEIDWNIMDSTEVDCRFRALNEFIGVYTHWLDGTPLRLGDIMDPDFVTRLNLHNLSREQGRHIPGQLYYHPKRHLICIAAANQTWTAFRSLTMKGRLRMSALGFYNTFIRPIHKIYRKTHGGMSPVFILGKDRNFPIDGELYNQNLISIHNYEEIRSYL